MSRNPYPSLQKPRWAIVDYGDRIIAKSPRVNGLIHLWKGGNRIMRLRSDGSLRSATQQEYEYACEVAEEEQRKWREYVARSPRKPDALSGAAS